MTRLKIPLFFLVAGFIILIFTSVDLYAQHAPKTGHAKLLSTVTINGTVTPGEYTRHYYDKKLKYNLYWRVIKGKIYFAIQSPDKGWIGLGLMPTGPAMKGADIYMGYVKGGKTYMNEEYANIPYSHVPITQVGGKNSIITYKGTVNAKGTTIEFSRLIKSISKHNVAIKNKTITLMFAYSNAKNFTTYHGPNRTEVKINLIGKTQSGKASGTFGMIVTDLTSYQIAWFIWGFLFLIAGIIGIVSTLIDRDVLKPAIVRKTPGVIPFLIITLLSLLDVAAVVIFLIKLFSTASTPSARGLLLALVFFILAIIVGLYRLFFIDDEVSMHEMEDGLPW